MRSIKWNQLQVVYDYELDSMLAVHNADLNISVVLLSQVNREGSKSQGLELYHLRDSGDIENDADVIILMWPYGADLHDSKRSDASGTYALMQYKLAKNREGERDLKGQFKFFNQYGRFF